VKHYNKMTRQSGMTLIELTVVLLVLIGLAGLMIPYVSGFMSRTHDGTGTGNLGRLNNAVQRFNVEKMRLPDDMHSLYSTVDTDVYQDLMNPAVFVVQSVDGTAVAGLAEKVISDSLNLAGLQTVYGMRDSSTAASATFEAADIATGKLDHTAGPINMVTIAPANVDGVAGAETAAEVVEVAFGLPVGSENDLCNAYIAVGIGAESELAGTVISDVPVHFAQQGSMGPENKYNRFVAVIRAQKALAPAVAGCPMMAMPATFVGSAMAMMPNHVIGLAEELENAYGNISN